MLVLLTVCCHGDCWCVDARVPSRSVWCEDFSESCRSFLFQIPLRTPPSGFLVWRVLTLKPDNGCPRIPIGCSTAKRLHGIGWDLGMRTHKLIIATELQRGRIAFYWESTFRWTQTVSTVNQSLMFCWSLHLRCIQQGPNEEFKTCPLHVCVDKLLLNAGCFFKG